VDFALLPAGSGNDFARTVDIDLDAERALHDLLERETRVHRLDLLEVEQGSTVTFAVNGLNGGFGAVVGETTTPDLKGWLGSFAYAVSAGRTLMDLEEYALHLHTDEDEFESRALGLLIMNGRTVGGGLSVAPGADPGDGLLDSVLVPPLDLVALSVAATTVLAGRADEVSDLIFGTAKEIHLDSDPPAPFTIDGNPGGTTPLTVRIRPGRFRFRKPLSRS
jgi:diacylglycerol kinase family enzyme